MIELQVKIQIATEDYTMDKYIYDEYDENNGLWYELQGKYYQLDSRL